MALVDMLKVGDAVFLSALLCFSLAKHSVTGERSSLVDITEANWEQMLQGEWMIEFFAPWCPACQELQPVWSELAQWGEELGVNIARVDVTQQPGFSGRFVIVSLPAIYHCKDGIFRGYQGPRTKADFLSFIQERKWQEIEPVSSWLSPSSVLMNIMSAVFRLSVFIRHLHIYLTEQLGLPVWGSYIVFTLSILLIGLVFGVVLVLVSDFMFPSQCPSTHRNYPYESDTLEDKELMQEEEELDDEDVEDDKTGEQTQDDGLQSETLRRRVACNGDT